MATNNETLNTIIQINGNPSKSGLPDYNLEDRELYIDSDGVLYYGKGPQTKSKPITVKQIGVNGDLLYYYDKILNIGNVQVSKNDNDGVTIFNNIQTDKNKVMFLNMTLHNTVINNSTIDNSNITNSNITNITTLNLSDSRELFGFSDPPQSGDHKNGDLYFKLTT